MIRSKHHRHHRLFFSIFFAVIIVNELVIGVVCVFVCGCGCDKINRMIIISILFFSVSPLALLHDNRMENAHRTILFSSIIFRLIARQCLPQRMYGCRSYFRPANMNYKSSFKYILYKCSNIISSISSISSSSNRCSFVAFIIYALHALYVCC
jgi:hypothetical protein